MEESEIDFSESTALEVPVEPERILKFARFAAGGMLLLSAGLAVVSIRLTPGAEWYFIPIGMEVLLAISVLRLKRRATVSFKAHMFELLGYVPALVPLAIALLVIAVTIMTGNRLWAYAGEAVGAFMLLAGFVLAIHVAALLGSGWAAQVWLPQVYRGRMDMKSVGHLTVAGSGIFLVGLACAAISFRGDELHVLMLPSSLGISVLFMGILALGKGETRARLGLAFLRSIAWGFPIFVLILMAGLYWESPLDLARIASWFLAVWLGYLACVLLVASGRFCRLILKAQEQVCVLDDASGTA